MVHRAPDSRLLTNLTDHEKEYARHLAALFPLSNAALASLSAYAAANPPTAQPIIAIVNALASADDALQRYTHAIDTWREQLVALKNLEDDLTAVLRDRDILVTRLIKASKSTRETHRTSRLVTPLSGIGSVSLSSLPSTSSATTASAGPASTNAKLAQAQAELQACEAHLAAKEHELDARRISIARDDLGARCRALIDCGWVWSEMGKQGLRALQALSAHGSSHLAPAPSSAITPRVGTTTYASDNSSVTPSQSASQIAARSAEASHEGPASKEHPEPGLGSKHAQTKDDEDLTITLPPPHAIAELTLPTSARPQHQPLQNGGPADTNAHAAPAPAPRRKRTKRPHRPPSQHITEVSDEGSDGPASCHDHNADANANTGPQAPHAPFPTSRAPPDTQDSSSDGHLTGPLQVVDNDPFEVIRRSMLGASPSAPSAHASAPDVRVSGVWDDPPKTTFPSSVSEHVGLTPGSGLAKRQRKTSMAFFGSLRGLFRKPKERDRIGTEWDEGRLSPSPAPASPRSKVWVTRTDARIGSRGEDSDEIPTPTGNVARRGTSGARLRKGRPSASARENGLSHRRVDGWITDSLARTGEGAGTNGASTPGRSRTRKGTMQRKKTSVADLRGSDQGHTDGEVDGDQRRSLERVSSKGKGKTPEAPTSKPTVEVAQERALADIHPIIDISADAVTGTQPRRATTTVATTSRKVSSNAPPANRRSASMSFMDAHVTSMSVSTQTGGMSWRKPPPQIEALSQPASMSQSLVLAQPLPHESQSKQNARRHLGNGHAHAHKHTQNQSLMSIVADVTRQNVIDKARSLDIPRAPGSVLHDVERGRQVFGGESRTGMGMAVNGRGHGRATSEDVGYSQGQGQGHGQGQRAIKMPLRSALRNASRTPSPSPAVVSAAVPVVDVESKEEKRGRQVVSSSVRDSASISSYETGRESLDGERSPVQMRSPPLRSPSPSLPRSQSRSLLRSQSQPPVERSQMHVSHTRSDTPSPPPVLFTFPPPPVDPPPVRTTASTSNPVPAIGSMQPIPNANTNEPPSPSASTDTPPVRRKSVRVSLQPTFSPTPPASYNDEDRDGRGYVPWMEPRGERADVWADSSDEDEAYSRARRLLSLVGRDRAKGRS